MRFIQYSRKSSEGDERQLHSIKDQNAVLARLVEQHKLRVVKRFKESKSAKLPGTRPMFAQMLEVISKGEADAILCWHLNRLSRNPVDSGQLSWMLQRGLIKCIKTPEREYRPEDNVVIMAVENAVANQYILDLKKSIDRAYDAKAARGWYPRRPPVGYLTNRDTQEIDIDPIRFPLMRRAWDLMLTASYTVPEVLEKLNGWGFRSLKGRTKSGRARLGKPMVRSKLYKLFDDPFYYGEFTYKGETHAGRHRLMVTRDEFEQVQAIIHRKSHIQPQRHTFAFTGLIRCGGCGCLVTAERKVKHYRTTQRTVTYVYYRCTRSKPCSEPCVTEANVDQAIQAVLDGIRLDPAVAAWAEAAINQDLARDSAWAPTLLRTYEQNLADVRSKLDRLLELRMAEEISAEEFRATKERYERDRTQTELALKRLKTRGETNLAAMSNALVFASRAAGAFVRAPEKLKRQIATNMAEAYVLTQGKLRVRIHPLLRQLSALEPPRDPHQRIRTKAFVPADPRLCSTIDNIRTLLKSEDVAFPHIDFDQQVQIVDNIEASKPPISTKRGSEETLAA